MRSQDFHTFLLKLNSEKCARDFLVFVLVWARAAPEDFEVARALPDRQAIQLSKELYPLYILENLDVSNTTRH